MISLKILLFFLYIFNKPWTFPFFFVCQVSLVFSVSYIQNSASKLYGVVCFEISKSLHVFFAVKIVLSRIILYLENFCTSLTEFVCLLRPCKYKVFGLESRRRSNQFSFAYRSTWYLFYNLQVTAAVLSVGNHSHTAACVHCHFLLCHLPRV